MAHAFRSSLQKRMWSFLQNEGDAELFLLKNNDEFRKGQNDNFSYSFFMNPYVQTSLLVHETINLDMSIVSGLTKLTHKSTAHDDRYTSVSYANWVINYFDTLLLKENHNEESRALVEATMIF